MNKTYLKWSFVCFLCSTFFFTLERVTAKMAASVAVIGQTGGYDTAPTYPHVTDNVLIVIMLLASFILLILALKDQLCSLIDR